MNKIFGVFNQLLQAWSVKNSKGNNKSAAKLEKKDSENKTEPQHHYQPTLIIHFK